MIHVFFGANPYGISPDTIGLPTHTSDLGTGITEIAALLMGLLGGLALLFMVVGAMRLTLSRGDPKAVQQGRQTILYAAVGLVVAIAGYAIVTFLANVTSAQH